MARAYWWKTSLSEQVAQVNNFMSKIGGYAAELGWTPAQVSAAIAVCQMIVDAINAANQCRSTMQAVTNWRDIVLYGEPEGSLGPKFPVFPVVDGNDFNCGAVDTFFGGFVFGRAAVMLAINVLLPARS